MPPTGSSQPSSASCDQADGHGLASNLNAGGMIKPSNSALVQDDHQLRQRLRGRQAEPSQQVHLTYHDQQLQSSQGDDLLSFWATSHSPHDTPLLVSTSPATYVCSGSDDFGSKTDDFGLSNEAPLRLTPESSASNDTALNGRTSTGRASLSSPFPASTPSQHFSALQQHGASIWEQQGAQIHSMSANDAPQQHATYQAAGYTQKVNPYSYATPAYNNNSYQRVSAQSVANALQPHNPSMYDSQPAPKSLMPQFAAALNQGRRKLRIDKGRVDPATDRYGRLVGPMLPQGPTINGRKMFTYSDSSVEFAQDLKFDSVSLAQYFTWVRDNPEARKPTLWIQDHPHGVNERFPAKGQSAKCRWKLCPVNHNTIWKGMFQVAIDELPDLTGDLVDPYHVAGYMHLYCLENCFNLVELMEKVPLRADDRDHPHEFRNPMALDKKLCQEFNDWKQEVGAKWNAHKVSRRVVEPVPDFMLDGTDYLWYRLTKAKIIGGNSRQRTSNTRKKDAAKENKTTLHLDQHKGDLALFAHCTIARANEALRNEDGVEPLNDLAIMLFRIAPKGRQNRDSPCRSFCGQAVCNQATHTFDQLASVRARRPNLHSHQVREGALMNMSFAEVYGISETHGIVSKVREEAYFDFLGDDDSTLLLSATPDSSGQSSDVDDGRSNATPDRMSGFTLATSGLPSEHYSPQRKQGRTRRPRIFRVPQQPDAQHPYHWDLVFEIDEVPEEPKAAKRKSQAQEVEELLEDNGALDLQNDGERSKKQRQI